VPGDAEWPKATLGSIRLFYSVADSASSRPVLCHVTSGEETRKKVSPVATKHSLKASEVTVTERY